MRYHSSRGCNQPSHGASLGTDYSRRHVRHAVADCGLLTEHIMCGSLLQTGLGGLGSLPAQLGAAVVPRPCLCLRIQASHCGVSRSTSSLLPPPLYSPPTTSPPLPLLSNPSPPPPPSVLHPSSPLLYSSTPRGILSFIGRNRA